MFEKEKRGMWNISMSAINRTCVVPPGSIGIGGSEEEEGEEATDGVGSLLSADITRGLFIVFSTI